MHAPGAAALRLDEHGLEELPSLREAWDRIALSGDTPFLTTAWLEPWSQAFADGSEAIVALRTPDGELVAAGLFRRRGGSLVAATGVETSDWDVVAQDDASRRAFWRALAERAPTRVELAMLPAETGSAAAMREELESNGYSLAERADALSPEIRLPDSFEELLASRRSSFRREVRRRQRTLEREGAVAYRMSTSGVELERDLETFLGLEHSGWKGQAGTSILGNPHLERLYREFARRAAEQGWLGVSVLELDGEPLAAAYGCVFGDSAYLIKTGFDESKKRLAPGIMLRAKSIRAAIEQGLVRYSFLGDPAEHKVQWTDDARPHLRVEAFRRGVRTAPQRLWWLGLRPVLKRAPAALRGR